MSESADRTPAEVLTEARRRVQKALADIAEFEDFTTAVGVAGALLEACQPVSGNTALERFGLGRLECLLRFTASRLTETALPGTPKELLADVEISVSVTDGEGGVWSVSWHVDAFPVACRIRRQLDDAVRIAFEAELAAEDCSDFTSAIR